MRSQWLENKKTYIRALKMPSAQQQLLLALADKVVLSKEENRKLTALIRAEKAAERVTKAKSDVARIINAEKKAEQKARNRELFQSAGLLILADLVDSKTGLPTWDKGELLGGLLALSSAKDEAKRRAWKAKGDAFLAAKSEGNNQKKRASALVMKNRG